MQKLDYSLGKATFRGLRSISKWYQITRPNLCELFISQARCIFLALRSTSSIHQTTVFIALRDEWLCESQLFIRQPDGRKQESPDEETCGCSLRRIKKLRFYEAVATWRLRPSRTRRAFGPRSGLKFCPRAPILIGFEVHIIFFKNFKCPKFSKP